MRIITFSLSVNFLGRPERALIFFIFDATQRIVDFLLFTILPISLYFPSLLLTLFPIHFRILYFHVTVNETVTA